MTPPEHLAHLVDTAGPVPHDRPDLGPCWLWLGGTAGGYGSVWVSGLGPRPAHRLAYEHAVGPVPAGLELDHLCRRRECVNPGHLEAVTHRENVLRAIPHRRPRSPRPVLSCALCGAVFLRHWQGHRWCSKRCAARARRAS